MSRNGKAPHSSPFGPLLLRPLRAVGLDYLDPFDLIHCVAMCANGNRLMLTLGDSLLPRAM